MNAACVQRISLTLYVSAIRFSHTPFRYGVAHVLVLPGDSRTSLDGGISQPFLHDLLSPHYGTFRTAVQNWGKEGAGTWMRDSFSNQTDLGPMKKSGIHYARFGKT